MRWRAALAAGALALARAAPAAHSGDATRVVALQHAPQQYTHAGKPPPPLPPPVLLENLLLPEDSVCANASADGFYAARRDPSCPCDCIGCNCRAYVACWACDPPPCRQQAFYECELGAGSFFDEDAQACVWLRLRVPPFDCPLAPPFPPPPPFPPAPPPSPPPPPPPPRPPRPPAPAPPAAALYATPTITTLVQPQVVVTQPFVGTTGVVGTGAFGGTGFFTPAAVTPGFTPALGAVGGVGTVGIPTFGAGGVTTTVTSGGVIAPSTTPFGSPFGAGAGAGSTTGSCDASICGQCLVPQGAAPGSYVCCCDRACKTNNAAADPKGGCCANFATACPGQQ